jgi:hypothetical protein
MFNKKHQPLQILTVTIIAAITADAAARHPLADPDPDAPPALAPEPAHDPSRYLLRAGFGLVYGQLSEASANLSYARPNTATQLQLTLGGAVAPSSAIYLHATWTWQTTDDAPLVINGREQPDSAVDLTLTALSPGLTWYFDAHNNYLTAHYHLPALSTGDDFSGSSTLAGHGFGLQLGHDWVLVDGLALGLAATGLYARNEYTEPTNQDTVALHSVYGGLLLTVTAR